MSLCRIRWGCAFIAAFGLCRHLLCRWFTLRVYHSWQRGRRSQDLSRTHAFHICPSLSCWGQWFSCDVVSEEVEVCYPTYFGVRGITAAAVDTGVVISHQPTYCPASSSSLERRDPNDITAPLVHNQVMLCEPRFAMHRFSVSPAASCLLYICSNINICPPHPTASE